MSLATNALLNVCSLRGWEAAGIIAGLDGPGRAEVRAEVRAEAYAAHAPKGGEVGGGKAADGAPLVCTATEAGEGQDQVRARARARASKG